MSIIHLDASKCVRSLSVDSACNKCEVICPTSAIVIEEGKTLPSINLSLCVGCAGCNAVCPTEAFGYEDFSVTDFFFDYLEEEDSLISCKKNIPCIAALSVEHLVSMAVLKKEMVLDIGHCDTCEIASTCYPQILKNEEEASYLLEAMQSDVEIKLEKVKYKKTEKTDRRGFLSSINLSTFAKTKQNFENEVEKASDELKEHTLAKTDIALLRKKRLPEKRKLFYTAIKRVEKPSQYHIIESDEISFTSQKLMDKDACTACQMCYRVCPTGALTSDVKNSKIDFDPFMCIKCNICHDVCEPNALTKSASYNIKEFFEPTVQSLINFKVKRCNECNVVFSTNSKDKLCYRCKCEEEEARELWGLDEYDE